MKKEQSPKPREQNLPSPKVPWRRKSSRGWKFTESQPGSFGVYPKGHRDPGRSTPKAPQEESGTPGAAPVQGKCQSCSRNPSWDCPGASWGIPWTGQELPWVWGILISWEPEQGGGEAHPGFPLAHPSGRKSKWLLQASGKPHNQRGLSPTRL